MSVDNKTWDYQGAWLTQFPQNTRSTIMNLFCYAVRDGMMEPQAVLQQVEFQVLRRKGRDSGACLTDEWLDNLVAALLDEEAAQLASHIIWRESLPYAEKAKLKEQASQSHVAAYMSQQPPTEKQLKYLRSLGCQDEPTSKKEASDLIELWLSKKNQKAIA